MHADFPDHAYPMHTHDCWTLLIVDQGVVRYELDRHQHGAMTSLVTLLPPNVPHDGRSVRPEGFRKRVLYLDPGLLGGTPSSPASSDPNSGGPNSGGPNSGGPNSGGPNSSLSNSSHVNSSHLNSSGLNSSGPNSNSPTWGDLDDDVLQNVDLTGAAVDHPGLADPVLRQRVHQLHDVLAWRTEDLEAQSRLLLIRERLNEHLRRGRTGRASSTGAPAASRSAASARRNPGLASQFRALLDSRVQPGISLTEAAQLLHSHPTHLVRAFSREFGMPPHLYLTGRRVELARRHLLAGRPTADAAVLAGFYDQSHLTRHFRRMLGVSPARFARAGKPVDPPTHFRISARDG
jgi:AraC-like DNA-binding protein